MLRHKASIWFRPALYSVFGLLALALPPVIAIAIPDRYVEFFEQSTVERVLNILSTSMLAIAIFSLSTMVSQLNAAASEATPRTRPLLSEDRTAQTAIATFIGTFLFSVFGLIGLELEVYDRAEMFVLFVIGVVLTLLVVLNLLFWIRRLSTMGGIGEAIERVERAAEVAFRREAADPRYGGVPPIAPTGKVCAIHSDFAGYVRSVDGEALGLLSEKLGTRVHLVVLPGDFVDATRPVVLVEGQIDEKTRLLIQGAIIVGRNRSFRKDSRYGVIVLSEIASRALSAGVNDPGTAIDVIGTTARVLGNWRKAVSGNHEPEPRWPRLHALRLDPAHVLSQAFRGIARDGARQVEVGVRIQHALESMSLLDPPAFGDAARAIAQSHVERARRNLSADDDVQRIEAAHKWQRDITWVSPARQEFD